MNGPKLACHWHNYIVIRHALNVWNQIRSSSFQAIQRRKCSRANGVEDVYRPWSKSELCDSKYISQIPLNFFFSVGRFRGAYRHRSTWWIECAQRREYIRSVYAMDKMGWYTNTIAAASVVKSASTIIDATISCRSRCYRGFGSIKSQMPWFNWWGKRFSFDARTTWIGAKLSYSSTVLWFMDWTDICRRGIDEEWWFS